MLEKFTSLDEGEKSLLFVAASIGNKFDLGLASSFYLYVSADKQILKKVHDFVHT